jgi:hypothetical protein
MLPGFTALPDTAISQRQDFTRSDPWNQGVFPAGPWDKPGADCRGPYTNASCAGPIQVCTDTWICPQGPITTTFYPCGVCIGG